MMFPKNCWYVAAQFDEVSAQTPLARTIINEPIVLYRDASGTPVVFEDRCCHRWAALSRGRIEGSDLRCMYHGFKYDSTGKCIEIPGQAQIPEGACVKRYAASVRYGWVWVWMGEAATADLSLIPTAPLADGYETVYEGFSDHIDYDANYQLINDNLTDFTHLSYVHSESFGAGLEWAQTRAKISAVDRGIRIQRWITSDTITPRILPEYTDQPLRNWTSIDYLAPGVLLMVVSIYTPQGMDEVDGGEPTADPLHSQYNWQAVTPVTETTSRYYFSWGVRRSENRAHITPILDHIIHAAFAEDKAMIENQQKVWNATTDRKMYGSTGDLGLHRMRRVIERLLEAERGPEQTSAAPVTLAVVTASKPMRTTA